MTSLVDGYDYEWRGYSARMSLSVYRSRSHGEGCWDCIFPRTFAFSYPKIRGLQGHEPYHDAQTMQVCRDYNFRWNGPIPGPLGC